MFNTTYLMFSSGRTTNKGKLDVYLRTSSGKYQVRHVKCIINNLGSSNYLSHYFIAEKIESKITHTYCFSSHSVGGK